MINLPYKYILFFALSFSQLYANTTQKLYFSGNCATCHLRNHSNSAPSITEVRDAYKSAFTDKDSFVKYMSEWVLKPNEHTSIMSDAIQKYELMPEIGYDLTTLKEISEYIYDTDFSKN